MMMMMILIGTRNGHVQEVSWAGCLAGWTTEAKTRIALKKGAEAETGKLGNRPGAEPGHCWACHHPQGGVHQGRREDHCSSYGKAKAPRCATK
jgi:hypothetical protein